MSKKLKRIAALEARVALLEQAAGYPQNKRLGPWPTPKSWRTLEEQLKGLKEWRIVEFGDAALDEEFAAKAPKGWDKVSADDPPPRGIFTFDEYPLHPVYLIRQVANDARQPEEQLYWSNDLGWCDFDSADRYPEEFNIANKPPMGGEYVSLDQLRKSAVAKAISEGGI